VKQKRDVQQGTLALMVLKTLQVLGPLHGYGIALRIAQISDQLLSINQGTLYPVLLRLEQEGAVASEWGLQRTTGAPVFIGSPAPGKSCSKPRSATGSRPRRLLRDFLK
jgi:hypothetical protein